MKLGLMTLPFLFMTGLAYADGLDSAGAPEPAASAAAPAKAQARMTRQRPGRLPTGDLRHCLDLKTTEAIIRCSETRRRQ